MRPDDEAGFDKRSCDAEQWNADRRNVNASRSLPPRESPCCHERQETLRRRGTHVTGIYANLWRAGRSAQPNTRG
jgi:hypothetical protein